MTARNPISPPNVTVDSSSSLNHSNAQVLEEEATLLTSQDKEFTSQDKELLSVLESIQNMNNSLNSRNQVSEANEGRLSGYFCSETVFNLSRKILTDTEIKILEKGLDFAPVQKKINEPELRSDIFGMNLPLILATYLMSSLNLSGVQVRVMLLLKFF